MIRDETLGRPIRNVQGFLRYIANFDTDIPPIIPDGVYGEQTEASVFAFQRKYGISPTGEVNYETWEKIVEVYDEISFIQEEPRKISVYPSSDFVIMPNDENLHLHSIQGIFATLSRMLPQLSYDTANGVHDESSQLTVKRLQRIFGLPQTGIIDRTFWERLVPFYESQLKRQGNLTDKMWRNDVF